MQGSTNEQLQLLLESEIGKIHTLTMDCIKQDDTIRTIETSLFRQLLVLGLNLLKFIIAVKLSSDHVLKPTPEEGEFIQSKGHRFRSYLSLFGFMKIERPSFYSKERKMIFPLDDYLSLPVGLLSYNLQHLLGHEGSEMNFRDSIHPIVSLLGLNVSCMQAERNIGNLSEFIEQFYEQQEVPIHDEQSCFCVSFDGKGVPKVKASDKVAQPPSSRLKRGEKRGTKQMATVVVNSSFVPKVRTKSMIINGLMGKEKETTIKEKDVISNDNRWHKDIHRRAYLADQDKAIKYGISRVNDCIKHPSQRFVVPIDAGIGLEDKVLHYVKEFGLENHFYGIVIDIVHVSEHVWTCANALLGEKSSIRTQWVTEVLENILDSKMQKVIDDLQIEVDKNMIADHLKEKICKTINYFKNHMHKMDYKECLAKGYPISSAIVESNCKHLIKDRMEQSGMRWSDRGAQDMMDVRAVNLNGDLPAYIDFIEQKERQLRRALVTEKAA